MKAAELYATLRSSGYRIFLKDDGLLGTRAPRPLFAEIMAAERRTATEVASAHPARTSPRRGKDRKQPAKSP